MGASSWAYRTPYQQDIQKALQELRQVVFQQGAYYTESAFINSIDEEEVAKGLSPDYAETFRSAMKNLRAKPEIPAPQTIEELIEMNAESGTHSILDIDEISENPEFGKAAPLTAQQLSEIFGTTQPTWDMIQSNMDGIQGLRQRWMGTYIIVYKDGVPDQIFFTGFSGD